MSQARRLGLETGAQPGQPGHTALTLASETQPLLGWFSRPTVRRADHKARAVLRAAQESAARANLPGLSRTHRKRIGTEEIMGIGDALNKAKDALSGHGDKVDEAVDQADQAVKDKTPDQADSVVDQAADKAKDEL